MIVARKGTGSRLYTYLNRLYSSMAEQLPLKETVEGSSPSEATNFEHILKGS